MAKQVFTRATPEIVQMVEFLRERWSGVAVATTSDVVREAIRRCVEAETKAAKKKSRIPSNGT